MATLTRPRFDIQNNVSPLLTSSIPAPFPSVAERERILEEELLEELASEDVGLEYTGSSSLQVPQESKLVALHEVLPSIAFVQKSCLMTLNDLLSVSTRWNPIVPDRRHSMPSTPQSSTMPEAVQPSSALQTLVLNLRTRDTQGLVGESASVYNNTELIYELERRVDSLAPSLKHSDAGLARALVSLLSHFNRLSIIQSPILRSRDDTAASSLSEPDVSINIFATLKRQLGELQTERLTHFTTSHSHSTPVHTIEAALLWNRIDEELENVMSMCREHTENVPRPSIGDHLPPKYDPADYQFDLPPEYEKDVTGSSVSHDDSRGRYSAPSSSNLGEKMRLDLEAVTMAIDRLYLVAPQLHNQRVELNTSKLEQMEKARRIGGQMSKGKEKERDLRELDNLLELLGKASERRMSDQSVVLEGGMKARLEKRQRDGQKHGSRVKDPDALLTLPEFIRESASEPTRVADPNAIVSLPEFIKEPIPDHLVPSSAVTRLKRNRSRSMSAPSLSWLRSSGEQKMRKSPRGSRPGSSSGRELTPSVGLDVYYVAENHENLQHMLVFMAVSGATPGVDIEAEVLPSTAAASDGDRLVVRSGLNTSPHLYLPGRTSLGKKKVRVQGNHYEIKLSISSASHSEPESVPLLDATQLSSSNPTSFICASCSLPLVQSTGIKQYRDLPSEHWQELVDAWMCHSDQTLHEHVARHGRGFWPEAGQVLVGGSYLLFEASSVNKNNLHPAEEAKRGEDWRIVRCICGAVAGRCQDYRSRNDAPASTVYRLAKYAIRPISSTAEPSRIPLSAFIVEDMSEFVHAHATYRFVIHDEEKERARMLIWLFKPSIRIAYARPTQYSLPKSASIHAAKVLFKILGPSTASSDLKTILDKYPGFPQAEYLFYPIDICRRLAGLLKESNLSYPESMRTMTGLDVGWLHRA